MKNAKQINAFKRNQTFINLKVLMSLKEMKARVKSSVGRKTVEVRAAG